MNLALLNYTSSFYETMLRKVFIYVYNIPFHKCEDGTFVQLKPHIDNGHDTVDFTINMSTKVWYLLIYIYGKMQIVIGGTVVNPDRTTEPKRKTSLHWIMTELVDDCLEVIGILPISLLGTETVMEICMHFKVFSLGMTSS